MEISVENLPYLETIHTNLTGLSPEEISNFSNELWNADLIILIGKGRSESAAMIGTEPLRGEKDRITPSDMSFPGKNLKEAMQNLLKRYDNPFILVNSGSGNTLSPKMYVQQAERIMDDYDFSFGVITSYPDSPIGKIGKKFKKKDRGGIITLKGRTKSGNGDPKQAMENGIMNDIYEQGSLLLLYEISKNNETSGDKIISNIDSEYEGLLKSINKYLSSEHCKRLLNALKNRSNLTVGGIGPSENVAKNIAIRMKHIKNALGDDAFLSGPFAPAPRGNDVILLISESGDPDAVKEWCKKFIEVGGYAFGITRGGTDFCYCCDCYKVNSPNIDDFCMRVTFITSPLPAVLAYSTDSPEQSISRFHSVTE